MTVRCIVALAAVLGALGARGAAAASPRPPRRTGVRPRAVHPRGPAGAADAGVVNMNRLGRALAELREPPVRAMYVWCSNPAAVAPDQNAVLARPRPRGPVPRGARAVHDRHRALRRRGAPRDHLARARRRSTAPTGSTASSASTPVIPPLGEAKRELGRLPPARGGAMGFEEPLFRLSAGRGIDLLLAQPLRLAGRGGPRRASRTGSAVELAPPRGPRWRTPSGKIELRNPALARAAAAPPRRRTPTRAAAAAPARHRARAPHAQLDASWSGRSCASATGGMTLRLGPAEAAARGLADGAAGGRLERARRGHVRPAGGRARAGRRRGRRGRVVDSRTRPARAT